MKVTVNGACPKTDGSCLYALYFSLATNQLTHQERKRNRHKAKKLNDRTRLASIVPFYKYCQKYSRDERIEEPGQTRLRIGHWQPEVVARHWCGLGFWILIFNLKAFVGNLADFVFMSFTLDCEHEIATCDQSFRMCATCIIWNCSVYFLFLPPSPFPFPTHR